MDFDLDYDSYIQRLTSDSVPQERAEHAVAEAVCDYMNELAENAYSLYRKALEQRCQEQGQMDLNILPTRKELPLELFTTNIKTNRLDATKWNATIQDFLLKEMPSAGSPPHADKKTEILNRLSAIDQQVNAAIPVTKELPPGARLFVPAIPVAMYVGAAVISAVLTTAGVLFNVLLHGGGTETRAEGGGGEKPSPRPNPNPDTTQRPRPNRADRERKRKRWTDKDRRRKARKEYYFGYVDRVEPAGKGYEIHVEAIAENSLSDEVFIRGIQKLAAAAGAPGFGRYRLALISIFVHTVPTAVEEGQWINFKVNANNPTPATPVSPDISGAFTDGVTVLESLEPCFSFVNLRTECYFAANDGYVVQTDLGTITKDIPASALTVLKAVFGTFNFVAETIKNVLDQFMNAKSTNETTGNGTVHDGPLPVTEDDRSLPTRRLPARLLAKKATKDETSAKKATSDKASTKTLKTALFARGERAATYKLYDVGQGHSGRVYGDKKELFANDFGYGRLGDRMTSVCSHMIRGQAQVPILLSHWDSDHFRIALSAVAKAYSGTADDVTRRIWVAPGSSHIIGPVTHELAWKIQQNKKYLQWPEGGDSGLEVGNITIVSCLRNKQYVLPDKNNFGALALIIGDGDDLLMYPGDANYESIPGIEEYDEKVRTMIATHHGSTVALKSTAGASIPKASKDEAHALFSYAGSNSYGHGVSEAGSYYENAGYKNFDTTAWLGANKKDTIEIEHFDQKDSLANNLHRALTDVTPSTQIPDAASVQTIAPGLKATSMPQIAADWVETARKQGIVAPNEGASKQFPAVLTLTGSGGATPKPDQDDLLQYAIRDEEGDIVIYDITAAKIVLEKLPLRVPCNTDYPVVVQLSCHDIEIRDAEPQAGVVPLVRFDVASGIDWTEEAKPGQDGELGEPGFAGGRVRLAVARDWVRTGTGAAVPISGLSIQYRGGRGGNGQNGGAGVPGKDGPDGGIVVWSDTDGKARNTSGPAPESGTAGGRGGSGGDAGAPGTIADSEVLAVGSKWPASWKVVIDTGSPGADREYGKTGSAGRGGTGGPGGKGSRYTLADMNQWGRVTMPDSKDEKWKMSDGYAGGNGDNGKEYGRSTAQFKNAKVNLRMMATEEEVLDRMAPVNWRYSSD